MSKQIKTVPMQHPTRMGRDGKPFIQQVNAITVNSGKATKLGYIPVSVVKPSAPPSKTTTSQVKPVEK